MRNFVSAKVVFARLNRVGVNINKNKAYLLLDIGDCLSSLKIVSKLVQKVHFTNVESNIAQLPDDVHEIVQIARDNNYTEDISCKEICESVEETAPEEKKKMYFWGMEFDDNSHLADHTYPIPLDCQGRPLIEPYDTAYKRPQFNLRMEWNGWFNSDFYRNRFTPIRPNSGSFISEDDCIIEEINTGYYCGDTYIEVPPNRLKLSFDKGRIAVAYKAIPLDNDGFPMIPDDQMLINALYYYCLWKDAESQVHVGEDFIRKEQKYMQLYYKYARKAESNMPKTIDDYEAMKNTQMSWSFDGGGYARFFKNLGR